MNPDATAPSSAIEIRRLTPDDAVAYQSIRLHGLRESPTAFSASYEEELAFPLSTYEQWLALRPDRGTFGAFEGVNLAGVVTLGRESKTKLMHKAHIWAMYVRPEFRRRGIARRLLLEAVALARSVTEIRQLNVGLNANNAAALGVYEAVGFRMFGREPGSLLIDGTAHDELLMSLSLERT